jgi:hypothetical protein
MRSALGWWSCLLVLSGCATVEDRLRTDAARDLGCQASRLHIADNALNTLFRVEGCGQVARYTCLENQRTLRLKCFRVHGVPREPLVVNTARASYSVSQASYLSPPVERARDRGTPHSFVPFARP